MIPSVRIIPRNTKFPLFDLKIPSNRRKPADFCFPDRDVNWNGYLKQVSPSMAKAIRRYVNYSARSWKQGSRIQLTRNLLSQLCGFFRSAQVDCVQEITPKIWFGYVEARLKEKIKPSTLNRTLWVLRSFLHYIQDENISICKKMLEVRPSKTGKCLPRALSAKRIKSLLEVVTEPLDRTWILLMLYSGLRTCEVRALCWEDVDLQARTVRINESKGLRSRVVFLSPQTVQALEGLSKNSDYIFTYRGKPLSSRYCQCRLQTMGGKCGVEVTPHQLRHSCATLLLNAGMSIFAVQKILGHKYIETTLKYARVYDATVARDFQRVSEVIREATT